MPEMTPIELRLAIAKAKGWKKEYGRMDIASRAPHEYYVKPDGTLAMYPPDWPTDFSAAMELYAEAEAEPHEQAFALEKHPAFNKNRWFAQIGNFHKSAETAPLAICRAWLAWKEASNAR